MAGTCARRPAASSEALSDEEALSEEPLAALALGAVVFGDIEPPNDEPSATFHGEVRGAGLGGGVPSGAVLVAGGWVRFSGEPFADGKAGVFIDEEGGNGAILADSEQLVSSNRR